MQPPVPSDLDLRDFQYMPLDVVRLVDSDLAALASGEEFRCAVILWCKAWHQVPASSLPDDDRLLAHLAGYGRDLKGWRAVKDMALRGFVVCEDGRLYHPVIAEKALEAAEAKRRQRERTAKATESKRRKSGGRDEHRHDERDDEKPDRDEHRDDDRNVHQGKGREGNRREDRGSVVARATPMDLEGRLREAAGWQSDPSPNLFVTGPIEGLIANGADLELDVLPVIRGLAPKARGRSWKFFTSAIAQARDDRVSASEIVSPPQDRRPGHVQRPQRKSTVDTILGNLGDWSAESDPPAGQA